ncbi:hypothetical protein CU098_003095 [Rhizopus stolonifer]|uniref:Poly [ADP-ribose] polymerase n=1 Tax=Rhizopus stolonifer TaxID=4846 RepID=A0A367JHZ3_RHIST|nr:hypothetical protein CU098_003095 [Rhizopus stolonifer]
MLYSYQPQVNHIDTVTGMTPLEFAIYQNSLIVVERLLALGADVNLESCSNFIENVMNPHKTKLPAVLHAILINKLEMISLICEKTPQSINYLWQDNKGNNMLSYVLGIVNGYSHSNIETLHYIANQMTSTNVKKLLRMKDVHGVPLVLYAYHRSNKELYKTLLSLDPTLQYFVSENYRSSDFDFENRPSLMSVDYIPTTKVDEDAQIERAKLQHAKDIESAKSGNKRQEKDELLKVDSYSKLERVGEIVLDENDIPYNIVLMKVELNSWGTYTDTSFYKLSIIYNKVLDVYILWTRWGPFGKEGQHQKTPYLTKEEAVQEFKAIFKAKTGNVWDDHRTSFTIKPGRYEIIQKAQHPKDTIIEDFDFLKSDKPTQLSAEVLNLMKIICNYDYLSRVYTNTQIDMPLGQIPQKCIEEARGILREVKALINTYRGLNNCYSDKAKLLESKIYAFKIAQKCVAYSRLLPRNGDAYQGIRSLYGNGENLKKELSNLEDLSYVSFAANVLLAAKHHCSEINPLEYAFRTLNCTLRPLSLDTELQEYDMINHYMKSTCKEEYNLVHLFAVNRADEEIRFRPFENELDRKLLWHGSRIGNFMGILKQGLRASPRTSSSNGALLGNGIYFADTFKKSLGYSNDTYGQSSSPFRIMLLCEVALGSNQGKMKQTPSEEYEMHDSVKGEGANIPDPSNALYDSNGVCIPFGPCISNTNIQVTGNHGFNNVSLNYNEYAVYNEDRVKIRYLLILREKNNCHLCAKPEPSKSLRPFFHHELSKYKYTDFNIYETEVVKAYLQHQGKTPQDIFSQDLNEFIEKKLYNTKWDTPLDLQQDSKICTKCAMIITTMMLEKRMVDNRDRLDVLDTLNQKPRCRYGKECKNQQSIHHTKKYKHWCFDKLTDDIHDAQEEELMDADNEHIMELDE